MLGSDDHIRIACLLDRSGLVLPAWAAITPRVYDRKIYLTKLGEIERSWFVGKRPGL